MIIYALVPIAQQNPYDAGERLNLLKVELYLGWELKSCTVTWVILLKIVSLRSSNVISPVIDTHGFLFLIMYFSKVYYLLIKIKQLVGNLCIEHSRQVCYGQRASPTV